MTNKKKYKYWLAVEESENVRFADLAHMMAKAMHPGDDEINGYAAARSNLEKELPNAVRDGLLRVRNPAGLGTHTFPLGNALQRAVLIPGADLEPFLNERSIELRLTPYGSGPQYWTLENTAAALQEQEGWDDTACMSFQDQLKEAAQRGEVVIRDPHKCLPIKSPQARTNWELVTPTDVNEWLEKLEEPFRWHFLEHAEFAEAWKHVEAIGDLEKERQLWESTPAKTITELDKKEEKIATLTAGINALNSKANPTPALAKNLAIESIRWHLLAMPSELITAFGTITGMNMAWFNNAKDAPKLRAARHTAGKGGRKGHEPLYRVFEVMLWLIDKKRRKGKPMHEATGWRKLKTQFPDVYEEYKSFEPEPD